MSDGITFDEMDMDMGENTDPNVKYVNFVNDGPANGVKIGLAIKEFDPTLACNFDFRNPDSFKFNILSSGLEEARSVLQYQLF